MQRQLALLKKRKVCLKNDSSSECIAFRKGLVLSGQGYSIWVRVLTLLDLEVKRRVALEESYEVEAGEEKIIRITI